MKKIIILSVAVLISLFASAAVVFSGSGCLYDNNVTVALAATETEEPVMAATSYTVQKGDSLWKIAVKYEIGLSELIAANPQLANPAMIYVGQKINIPNASPLKSIEDEIVKLVNQYRVASGLQPLTQDWQASRVARYKSEDMIKKNYFSHTSPTYGSPFKMMESYGLKFSAAGENIAYGQRSAQEVMNTWMNSAGHKANILSKTYTHIGVGVAKKSNGTLYFTQLFFKKI